MTDGPDAPRSLADPVGPGDHVTGQGPDGHTPPLTLVEYGDYECPDCMDSHPIVARLLAEFAGRIRFVFRHFPLVSIHPHASAAASAAEAAGAQGKFWAMHDLLYASRGGLAGDDLGGMAIRLGLEIYKFEADVTSRRFAGIIRAASVQV